MLNFVLMRSAFCRGVPLPTAIALPFANSPAFKNLNFVAHEISKFSDNGRIIEHSTEPSALKELRHDLRMCEI